MVDVSSDSNARFLYLVNFSEAEEYAEWVSIILDLQFVIRTNILLIEMGKQPIEKQEAVLMRSLWTSALITYARCFSTGKRVQLEPKIYSELSGEPLETHQYYINTRNKHIAHSVNDFEEIKVGIAFEGLEKSADAIVEVAYLHSFRICDCEEGVKQLGSLATVALRHAEQRAEVLRQQTLEKAKKLNQEELQKLMRLKITAQGGTDVAKGKRG